MSAKSIFFLIFFGCTWLAASQTPYFVIDSGFVFENPPFQSCHSSTVVEMENGNVLCAWFGGKHEGSNDVSIWLSELSSRTWTSPTLVADGIQNDTTRYACWNPVLYRDKTKLFLFYKVGTSPSTWWGEYKVSTDDGKTWSKVAKLPDGILGPIKNKAIRIGKTVLHPSSTETAGNTRWKSFIELSDRNLTQWKSVPIDTASSYKVIQPTLLCYGENRIQALLRSDSNEILQSWSNDNGQSWTPITGTGILHPNSGIDAVGLSNGVKLLVYNPAIKGENWWDGRSRLTVAESVDGLTWNDILILEKHEKGEFSYPAIIRLKNDDILITYTYNRLKIKYIFIKTRSR